MTLSELIGSYRSENNLSQRQLALKCGLSNGCISMLEKGINPNTKQSLTPTIPVLKKLANGMGMNLEELVSIVDDMPVSMLADEPIAQSDNCISKPISALEQQLLSSYRSLNPEGQAKLIDYADDLVSSGKYIKSNSPDLGQKQA